MNLYAVRIVIDVVAYAPDEEAAARFALSAEQVERAKQSTVESVTRVIDPAKLPGKWDAGCLPYGREDDTTIGMIIGYPVQKDNVGGAA